ncbi:MAG: hypothetical protein Q8916_03950 [Bacteroidota bacterium]|nr:hypothetical protein [Bacteroidota bacterium]MDP4229541.1 hypothetical protein [Bacteroidota bacterium]MDP4235122.1 hypothetical protein [Bacteroidota bacterium]
MLKRIAAVLSAILLVLAVYFVWARPYQLRWGATDSEVLRAMPGDSLDLHPTFLATRAITIDTSPEAIWPWLVQMGFNRAGFYGYDIIEGIGNTRSFTSADSIIPELQHPKVGDAVPISLAAQTQFSEIDPYRVLIWAEGINGEHNGGFIWALYPINRNHTRLVSRIRWSHHWRSPWLLSLELLTEFTDHLALRKILPGIKVRAENKKIPTMAIQTIEFFFYFAAALIFLYSILFALIKPLTRRTYLLVLAAGAMWLIIWYSPLWIGAGAILELSFIGYCIKSRTPKTGHHRSQS